MLNELQSYLFVQIQTSQTGGQLYSDIFPTGSNFFLLGNM